MKDYRNDDKLASREELDQNEWSKIAYALSSVLVEYGSFHNHPYFFGPSKFNNSQSFPRASKSYAWAVDNMAYAAVQGGW
jgi:hypothetical protein